MIDECPNCGAQLCYTDPKYLDEETGEPIKLYHTFAIYDIDLDRTTYWMCPFCEYQWPRV